MGRLWSESQHLSPTSETQGSIVRFAVPPPNTNPAPAQVSARFQWKRDHRDQLIHSKILLNVGNIVYNMLHALRTVLFENKRKMACINYSLCRVFYKDLEDTVNLYVLIYV